MTGSTTIKLQPRVLEALAGVQQQIERHGWQRLPLDMHQFFQGGVTRGSVMEAAIFALKMKIPEEAG